MKTLNAIGALYILSALWCIFRLDMAAAGLGFQFANSAAQLEYFSVYGGLQLGLGVAMIAASLNTKLILGALYFSLVFSTILVTTRAVGLFLYEPNTMMWMLLVLEAVIALALLNAYKQYSKSS